MSIKFRFILILCILSFLGCQKDEIKISHPDGEEAAHIKAIGDSISLKLLRNLKKELTTAISEKGLVEAIKFCNVQALPFTEEIAKSSGLQIDIKRTSVKYRNPKNAPNEVEMAALKYFEELSERGESLPPLLIQKVEESGKIYFVYYKPLKAGSLCLACHGDTENMGAQLKSALQELYPHDKAIGYKEGDFRGVVRINISESI